MSTSAITVETIDRGPKAVSRRVVVDLPAEAIFARLVDPRRHHELDGSGTVGRTDRVDRRERHLVVGAVFSPAAGSPPRPGSFGRWPR